MELNILKPARAVHQAFYNPNVPIGFVLVLLPTIFSIIGTIAFGLQFNFVVIGISAASTIASWVAMAILLYIIGFVIEGNSLKGKFTGVLSALSLLWIVFTVMAIAGFVLIASLPIGVIASANQLQQGKISDAQAGAQIVAALENSAITQNLLLQIAFTIVAFVLIIYALLLLFLIAKEINEKSIVKQLAITIIFIVAWAIVSGISTIITG